MAFTQKSGSRVCVKQGNNGRTLSCHGSQKAANKRVAQLHAKNKPAATNRGASAKKRETNR